MFKKTRVSHRQSKFILICLLVLFSFTALAIRDLNTVSGDLLEAKDLLAKSYQQAQQFDIKGARRNLDGAERKFIDARRVLSRPVFRSIALVPMLGNNINAAEKLSASGAEATRAGLNLLDAAEKFSGSEKGPSLKYAGGKFDLGPFIEAGPHIKKARVHLLISLAEEQSIPKRFLLPQIKKSISEYSEKITKLKSAVDRADKTLDMMPPFLGASGKRSYFLAVQNNAELRATGGLIGNYGIIEVDNGKLSLGIFDQIHALERADLPAAKVTEDFHNRYDKFGSDNDWLNANMSPDLPTVSNVLLQLYKSSAGQRPDGVIAIDPVGLKYLLEAIGPIKLDDSRVIDANNVVGWTLVDAYKVYGKQSKRKDFLKEVAVSVWGRIASGDIQNLPLLATKVAEALSDKHLMLFSADAAEEEIIKELGYAGAMDKAKGDYLQVIVQNQGGNKIDIYLEQSIDYNITIKPDGSVLSVATITFENKAPKQGLPIYVSGENPAGAKDSQSNSYISVYVPGGSSLLSYTHDGQIGEAEVGREKDKTVFSCYLKIPAGEKQMVSFTYTNSSQVPLIKSKAHYLLDWQVQPVINKPRMSLRVSYPKDYEAVSLSDGLVRQGGAVLTDGALQKDTVFYFGLREKSRSRWIILRNGLASL